MYDIYWDGKRVDRHIRKFIDNTTFTIEEEVTWALFKKNTGFNCTTLATNNRFIKHLKLINYLLPTLEIMKERRYNLYKDAKCKFCLIENEDEDHIIYCQQLKDKWITIANNTVHQCDQVLTNFTTQEKQIQIQLN
ncbi:hypothetical protein GLOIN_2v1839374 [Rhizophagus clarus]|uniref:Uncharacterized protein n=1 Tax=Rhizophagus clarus TaxID=94130 RepID=A0A8H3M2M5_9GLOM|nr:hypothetical protein GLOIN_2v1839374 [Rhizophagus clarus]